SILSNSAKAEKPLGIGETGWGEKLPNNSVPLLISPSLFRSNTRNALSTPGAVHAICARLPVPVMSNRTPFSALVRTNPCPDTSMMIGEHPSMPPPPSLEVNRLSPEPVQSLAGGGGEHDCSTRGTAGVVVNKTTTAAPKKNGTQRLFTVELQTASLCSE